MDKADKKAKKSTSSKPSTPGQRVKAEFQNWKSEKSIHNFSVSKLNEEETTLEFKIGKGKHPCTLTYPDDYPASSGFFLFSAEDGDYQTWTEKVNEFSDSGNKTAVQIFEKMVQSLQDLKIGSEKYVAPEEFEDEVLFLEDDGDNFPEEEPLSEWGEPKKKAKEWTEADEKVSKMTFAHQTSDSATLRLVADLKNLMKSKPEQSGFSATPTKRGNLDDLYTWEVRLFGFEGDLAKDLQAYKRKTGKDYILLHLRFSKDYPFKPPFVRVIEPVFQFHTGHVTLGGAICMELLTNSGWKPFNDVEQIIIQVRVTLGTGRLDLNQSSNTYSESEAWTAFYRAAANHGWDVKDLGPQMFPKF